MEISSTTDEEERCEKEPEIDMLTPPVWGEDSFDGMEYYESTEAKAVSDDDEEYISKLKVWNEDYRKNKRKIIESKGFRTDPNVKPSIRFKGIRQMPFHVYIGSVPDITFGQYFEEMVHVCLDKLNKESKTKAKEEGYKVEFVELVRGNYRGGPRDQSYITFMAREKSDGPLVEYQAKCMHTMDGKRHPMLCRRAPTI